MKTGLLISWMINLFLLWSLSAFFPKGAQEGVYFIFTLALIGFIFFTINCILDEES